MPNRLASSMRGTGRMIGTVVPPLINSGIAEQVQGMSDECHESGYSMLLVQGEFTQEAEEKSIRTLLGWRPAGMILQSFVQSDAARALLKSSGAPVVEISEIKGRKPLDMVVGVSNFETAYAMTMHLAAKGYKRIGFVSTPIHGNDRLQQRRTGYHAALSELGIENHDDMEVEVPITAQGGAEALVTLTDRHKDIDAIFFSSDTLAVGADPGMPSPPLGSARPHRHCRLWRHGSRGAALSAADHGQGQPLRDGAARRAAVAGAARRRPKVAHHHQPRLRDRRPRERLSLLFVLLRLVVGVGAEPLFPAFGMHVEIGMRIVGMIA